MVIHEETIKYHVIKWEKINLPLGKTRMNYGIKMSRAGIYRRQDKDYNYLR